MKLYFYFLEEPYNKEPYIRCEECEVDEKPKTYKFISSRPSGFYGSYVRKDDVGQPMSHCVSKLVILAGDNKEAASSVLKSMCQSSIRRSIARIKDEEENIEKQMSLIEMVDRWKSE